MVLDFKKSADIVQEINTGRNLSHKDNETCK